VLIVFLVFVQKRINENTKGDNGMKAPASHTRDLSAAKSKDAPASHKPTRRAAAPVPVRKGVVPVKAKDVESAPGFLNFRVPAEFKREFKTYAASHDMKMNELLRRSFRAYREQQGD
jgi:putative SOS response-associated peptidase YedK